MKPLNSGQLRVLKNLSVIERCLLLRGNLKKIVLFGTKYFVRYSWHVRYLGYPLLAGFTVLILHFLFKIAFEERFEALLIFSLIKKFRLQILDDIFGVTLKRDFVVLAKRIFCLNEENEI